MDNIFQEKNIESLMFFGEKEENYDYNPSKNCF
jgi:hypothetical protein